MGNEISETTLIIRCQLGEAEAWEELVQLWHPRLTNFAYRMLNDSNAVEDVVQNIWIKIIRSMGRLRQPEHSRAWIYQIARNSIADLLRLQYRMPLQIVLEDVPQELPQHEWLDAFDQLQFGLAELHPADREVVVLYYLEELTVGAISSVCGIPEGTVKSRLFRARTQLREIVNYEQ